MQVTVEGSPGSYVATIEFVESGGERITRVVRGAFCPDVVEGMALVTALAFQSREAPSPEETAPASATEGAPPSAEPASEFAPPPAKEPPPAVVPPSAPAVAPKASPAEPEPSRSRPDLHLRTSARAAIATGIGPKPAPGLGIGVVLERRAARYGVALQGFWTGRVLARGVPAHFELLAARFEACPYAPRLTRAISVEPSLFAELGRLTGEAYEDPPAVIRGFPGSALWLSTGASVRAVGHLGALSLELEALLGASLRRERFSLERGEELHTVPVIHGAVAVGLGVRL